MRSPASAIAWDFWRRHRWGFVAFAVYIALLPFIKVATLVSGRLNSVETPLGTALLLVVPLAASVMYILAVFSYGFSGDLAARRSIYPARMFTLPVSTAELTRWPMVYGSVALVILWAVTRLFAPMPAGVPVPAVWPALLGVVVLTWTQALAWMPYGLPGVRVVVSVLCLTAIDIMAVAGLFFEAHEFVMVAVLAPQVVLAYLVARLAVARARRGHVPDWRTSVVALGRIASRRRAPHGFDSPNRAQTWFEWRRHGGSLPALVGILLPFELALLFVASGAPLLVLAILVCVMLTPSFMAAFAAATVRRASRDATSGYGVTPFTATRPLNSSELIGAKLKMALRSTLTTWVLVLVTVPIALQLSSNGPMVVDWLRSVFEALGTPRATLLVLLTALALVSSTWKQLAQSFYIGLSGRAWAVKASVFVNLVLLVLLGPLTLWILEQGLLPMVLWEIVPWVMVVLAGLKLCGAGWVVTRLSEERLVSNNTIIIGLSCWLVAVFVLYGLLKWFFESPYFPGFLLLLVPILVIPLVRVSAAPLAFARNRHR